jgi:hypothetical protein
MGVELIVGNELNEQSDAVKAGVVLQQWQEQLSSPTRGARSQPLGVATDEDLQLGLVDYNDWSSDGSSRHALLIRRWRVQGLERGHGAVQEGWERSGHETLRHLAREAGRSEHRRARRRVGEEQGGGVEGCGSSRSRAAAAIVLRRARMDCCVRRRPYACGRGCAQGVAGCCPAPARENRWVTLAPSRWKICSACQ